ncbi:MAG: hypothetical protein EKK48_10245 [Candidatus Melainabacteria bacterium]|nr:MAG: hypothetical protein EKK48_10245 [Candidatus Melainabacteria bacterium]
MNKRHFPFRLHMINKNLPSIPYDNSELRELVQAKGGWVQLLDPNYHPTEELYEQFKKFKFDHKKFDELRVNAKEIFTLELAVHLYWSWRWLLDGTLRLPRPAQSPFEDQVRWQDFPHSDYWYSERVRERLTRFQITKDAIEDCILSDAEKFPPWKPPASRSFTKDLALIPENTANDAVTPIPGLERRYLLLIALAAGKGLSIDELMLVIFLLQNEVKTFFLSTTYSFRLYPYGAHCDAIKDDIYKLVEDQMVLIDHAGSPTSELWLYSASEKGSELAEKTVRLLSTDLTGILKDTLVQVKRQPIASLKTSLYRRYPKHRG